MLNLLNHDGNKPRAQPAYMSSLKLYCLYYLLYTFCCINSPNSTPPSTEKECLSTCVQNMQQSDDLSPLEIVEMFAGLSCFLKDSSDVSQTLLDDFRMCQGYAFLCDLMLRYSSSFSQRTIPCWALRALCTYKLLSSCPDWNRLRKTNQKMHWRTWWTWSPVSPHTGWRSWNLLAWQPEPPSCCLASFFHSLLGKVC